MAFDTSSSPQVTFNGIFFANLNNSWFAFTRILCEGWGETLKGQHKPKIIKYIDIFVWIPTRVKTVLARPSEGKQPCDLWEVCYHTGNSCNVLNNRTSCIILGQ